MVIKLSERMHELIDIVATYEKEHGPIDENAPKEIQEAYKEFMAEAEKINDDYLQ